MENNEKIKLESVLINALSKEKVQEMNISQTASKLPVNKQKEKETQQDNGEEKTQAVNIEILGNSEGDKHKLGPKENSQPGGNKVVQVDKPKVGKTD